MPALVFYAFSFHSPYSALADSRIDDLLASEGCEIEPLPLVPPIPPEPAGVDALVAGLRSSYIVEDSARWAAELGLAWNPPPPPVRFGEACASSAAWFYARERGVEREFRNACFRARFGAGRDSEARETLVDCATAAGLDADALLRAAESDEYRARGPAELPRMARQGVFGVPLFRLEGERFFGNDRLDVLVRALRARARPGPPATG